MRRATSRSRSSSSTETLAPRQSLGAVMATLVAVANFPRNIRSQAQRCDHNRLPRFPWAHSSPRDSGGSPPRNLLASTSRLTELSAASGSLPPLSNDSIGPLDAKARSPTAASVFSRSSASPSRASRSRTSSPAPSRPSSASSFLRRAPASCSPARCWLSARSSTTPSTCRASFPTTRPSCPWP